MTKKSRRTVVKTVGAAGLTAGLGGCIINNEDGNGDGDDNDSEVDVDAEERKDDPRQQRVDG